MKGADTMMDMTEGRGVANTLEGIRITIGNIGGGVVARGLSDIKHL